STSSSPNTTTSVCRTRGRLRPAPDRLRLVATRYLGRGRERPHGNECSGGEGDHHEPEPPAPGRAPSRVKREQSRPVVPDGISPAVLRPRHDLHGRQNAYGREGDGVESAMRRATTATNDLRGDEREGDEEGQQVATLDPKAGAELGWREEDGQCHARNRDGTDEYRRARAPVPQGQRHEEADDHCPSDVAQRQQV